MCRKGRDESRLIIQGDDGDRDFLVDLSILAVDEDQAFLSDLSAALSFLGCFVQTCCDQSQGFSILQDNSRKFDAVLVNIDSQTGFQLVEFVGRRLGLPVVVMCSVENKKAIKEGINHGACGGLVKPWGVDELENIWQYMLWFKKRGSNRNGISSKRNGESIEASHPPKCEKLVKSLRLVWTDELNAQFIDAVNLLGGEKATAKKILEIMNVPGLTRENIASHLQAAIAKYRMALKKRKAMVATYPEDGNNSRLSQTARSNLNQINTEDTAQQLGPLHMPSLTSLPRINDQVPQLPLGDMYMQPNFDGAESSAMTVQRKHVHAQMSAGCPDEFIDRNSSSNGFPPVPPAQSYGHPSNGHNPSLGDYQTGQLEMESGDVSCDQLFMDLDMLMFCAGATQEIREPSPSWIVSDNMVGDPVKHGALDVAGNSSTGITAMMNNPQSSEQGQGLGPSTYQTDLGIDEAIIDWDFSLWGP